MLGDPSLAKLFDFFRFSSSLAISLFFCSSVSSMGLIFYFPLALKGLILDSLCCCVLVFFTFLSFPYPSYIVDGVPEQGSCCIRISEFFLNEDYSNKPIEEVSVSLM